MTDDHDDPTNVEELVAAATENLPDELIPLVERWLPLELEAVNRGIGTLSTEILTDARYSSLAGAIARLRADVANRVHLDTTGEPLDGDYVDEIRQREQTRIEVEALEHALPRIEQLLDDAARRDDAKRLAVVPNPDDDGDPRVRFPSGLEHEVTPEVVETLLLLVDREVPRAITRREIEQWGDETRLAVAEWAGATHLHASDNDDVVIPPRPAVLDELDERVPLVVDDPTPDEILEAHAAVKATPAPLNPRSNPDDPGEPVS